MGRIMALDVGDVRIGIAVSDLMGIIANPLETYTRKGDIAADARYIADLAYSKDVSLFVSGLPLSLDGTENAQTAKTREFVAELSHVCTIPVEYLDERFTTVSAERVLIEGNVRRENRKKVIDKVAATIILQNYLDKKDKFRRYIMTEIKKDEQCCDCGCEQNEHHHDENCDCGCENVDEDVVMLEDEDGNEIPFYHIATLDRDGKEYACLQQADDEDPIVEIFELQEVEEDGEVYYNFLPVDDELYDSLYAQLEKEVAEMDECADPNCDCHND